MKLIIAGSRDFDNYTLLRATVQKYLAETLEHGERVEIVSGGARGADSLGERFAEEFRLEVKKFIPDWDRFGKSAGYRRNAEMADYGTHYLIFFASIEKSRGSEHMLNLALQKGLCGMAVFPDNHVTLKSTHHPGKFYDSNNNLN